MIPAIGGVQNAKGREGKAPSRAFRLDFEKRRFDGMTDGREAVEQAVAMIVSTRRFGHLIFSRNYGAELQGLAGKPTSLAKSEAKRLITEALLQDTRVKGVDQFTFETGKKSLICRFVVNTEYGESNAETSVEI